MKKTGSCRELYLLFFFMYMLIYITLMVKYIL